MSRKKADTVQPCATHQSLGQAPQSTGNGELPEALGQKGPRIMTLTCPNVPLGGCQSSQLCHCPHQPPGGKRLILQLGLGWSSGAGSLPTCGFSSVVTGEKYPERGDMCKPIQYTEAKRWKMSPRETHTALRQRETKQKNAEGKGARKELSRTPVRLEYKCILTPGAFTRLMPWGWSTSPPSPGLQGTCMRRGAKL